MGGRKLFCAAIGVGLLSLLLFAPGASATTGSIEGLTIAPDLAAASVSSLDVSYDECPAEVPDCSWTAAAMLAPPQWGYCPPTWSLLLEAEGNPPGLPDPPPGSFRQRHLWSLDFSGNGEKHSGPLTFGLEGVDDYRLCLYATHFSASPVSNTTEAHTAYVPPIETPNLLAERLLHVDIPAIAPPSTTPAPKRLRCKRGRKRVIVHGRERCRKVHGRRHRRSRG